MKQSNRAWKDVGFMIAISLILSGCKALEVTADICDLITFDDKPAPRSGTVIMDDGETFDITEAADER